ncbi:MAG: type II toxin-antitoxin system HicA family toxin [Coriobacteriales bacterium]|jgi:predicted RNA binding protein YcfA (HicA-like mRNA interferase family)|nr:type II toxin-antitoxin system HicA family toxin [Coriobacteriales bacterium]
MEPPTIREVTRRLENEGFVKVGQKGSHCRYQKGNLKVTVAGKPSKHLNRRTWKSIQRQAGW